MWKISADILDAPRTHASNEQIGYPLVPYAFKRSYAVHVDRGKSEGR